MSARALPMTRPRSATDTSTHSYGSGDADHSLPRAYFGLQYLLRARDPDRNSCTGGRSSRPRLRSAHGGAATGNLGCARTHTRQTLLPAGRTPRTSVSGDTWTPGPEAHAAILGPGGAARVHPRSIVMPLSSPRYLAGRPGGTASSLRPPVAYSPVPVAHLCSFLHLLHRSGAGDRHQCQLRTAFSFLRGSVVFGSSPVPVAHFVSPFVPSVPYGGLTSASCARRPPFQLVHIAWSVDRGRWPHVGHVGLGVLRRGRTPGGGSDRALANASR